MKEETTMIIDWLAENGNPEIYNKVEKETLEEVAEKWLNKDGFNEFNHYDTRPSFIQGAKWQQERMYSEEDMKSFGDWCRNGLLNTEYGVEKLDEHLEQWKQFKKK
jgi:hypothetical protein